MSSTNNMLNEVIDLATIMRPFLMGKRGPVVMTTLCLLTAESLINTGAPGLMENNIEMVANCVRDYVVRLERTSDDAP